MNEEIQEHKPTWYTRKLKVLEAIINSSDCISVKKENEKMVLKFRDGQIFKCSGPLVDELAIQEKQIVCVNQKKLF